MEFIKFGRFKIYFEDENLFNEIQPLWNEIQNFCESNNIKIKSVIASTYHMRLHFNNENLLNIIFNYEFNDFKYHKNNRKIYKGYTYFPNISSDNFIEDLKNLKTYITNNFIN